MMSIGAQSLFIDIRPRDVSDAGHLPAANHICVPLSQADVEAKMGLPAITERAAQKLFANASRARFGIVVYGQVCVTKPIHPPPLFFTHLLCMCLCDAQQNNEAAVSYLINLIADEPVKRTHPLYYAIEGIDGFISHFGSEILCRKAGAATSRPNMGHTHKHEMFIYPSCIVPKVLYLGNEDNAGIVDDSGNKVCPPQIQTLRITHVLNVTDNIENPQADELKVTNIILIIAHRLITCLFWFVDDCSSILNEG
jgi:hypothetical protein